MEGGGGKGVHFGGFRVLRCFFHCGEAREGFSEGNFFYKVIMGRGKGCTSIFFLLVLLLLKGGGQFFFFSLDI